jgi:flagellar motor protein MotB
MIAMMNRLGTVLSLVAAVLVLGSLTGCQDALKTRNSQLTTQNEELQAELNRAWAARDAATAENQSLVAELARLQAERDAAARNVAVAPPAANAGFGGIADTEVIRGRGTITVRVPGDVLFASGSADLREASRRTLQQIAAVIRRDYPANQVRIEGHTDSDPIRRTKNLWRDNYHLSEARARSVRDYLAAQGVSSGSLQIVGNGPDKPVGPNTSAAGKLKNRRVEIIVLVAE